MELDQTSDSESNDSDTELQIAFAKGELKPGLNIPTAAPKQFINNVAGMQQKLAEIKSSLGWIERLDLTVKDGKSTQALEEAEGQVHDDFKREMIFYTQAQQAILKGLNNLHQLGIPTKRPDDYFAQMIKSDNHMKKIRERLLSKQMGMERSEKAKKLRELRKVGKKVQVDVIQKRHKEKREMLEAVKKYKKGKQDALDFLNADDGPKQGKKPKPGAPAKKDDFKPGKKREYKNKKFGYGGQKKRSKYNTKESAADLSGFSSKKHATRPGKLEKKKMSNKNKRPGKQRRQASKNKR
ncbi:unnamed protein product [Owenia fusiformis]|uniref:rRNA-processing protein EBP2 n=1 Tax=Owenia fusiformis TaxID=6347 RepID=A0A8S4N438_OWEFU|nr:unnamed protein product [Owenia fusiformis]